MIYTYTNLELPVSAEGATAVSGKPRALEDPAFPFEQLSEVAELESWRKEINRPIYHVHKWWAQRLGSVFRGILIGAVESDPDAVMRAFYSRTAYPEMVVFDPFMGSGTTIGEASKLGMRGIGRDINHVAYFAVRNALAHHDRQDVIDAFEAVEHDVGPTLRRYYHSDLGDGNEAVVLYYFWVMVVPCPSCSTGVDLFSSFVFARHAYPRRFPAAKVVCPSCGEIIQARYDAHEIVCGGCHRRFDPQHGAVRGSKGSCPCCGLVFSVAEGIRETNMPPDYRLYAKLVLLLPDGSKEYQRAGASDSALFAQAVLELESRLNPFPIVPIMPGHNTDQALNYGFRYWHEMFNARQLLGLSILSERIRAIDDCDIRDLFVCLFSGALEFNNMFASYKGEGTGAVRHMFAHHVLKPERMPLEANLWGTPKSSGAFSTLFRSRLLRALDYRDRPFEIRPRSTIGKQAGVKVYGLSRPLGQPVVSSHDDFVETQDSIYLSWGDSAQTDLPAESVDLVVTDPPFFDNVHYSELADFFHVWQRHILGNGPLQLNDSTRSHAEVQSRDPILFAAKLGTVFAECYRVLRPDGLMVFTYHHSRPEGWHSILDAIGGAGFVITAAHPVKSEMSVAAPKAKANSPIDIDVILVCRKAANCPVEWDHTAGTVDDALSVAADQVQRMRASGRTLSRNDVRVIVMAQLVRVRSWSVMNKMKQLNEQDLEEIATSAIDRLHGANLGCSAEGD